jgi:hypothetical protein
MAENINTVPYEDSKKGSYAKFMMAGGESVIYYQRHEGS